MAIDWDALMRDKLMRNEVQDRVFVLRQMLEGCLGNHPGMTDELKVQFKKVERALDKLQRMADDRNTYKGE